VRIALDPTSPIPPSVQVRRAIAGRIVRGSLLPGTRIPTVRELAGRLGLAPNTVAKAYRELEADGLLIGRGRRGTFVAERLPTAPSDGETRLTEAADAFVRRARQLGVPTVSSRSENHSHYCVSPPTEASAHQEVAAGPARGGIPRHDAGRLYASG
jgi:DNA-binding transcriptional regulator YhcF (GntR family)